MRRKDREIKEVIDLKDIEGKYGESVSWERLAKERNIYPKRIKRFLGGLSSR